MIDARTYTHIQTQRLFDECSQDGVIRMVSLLLAPQQTRLLARTPKRSVPRMVLTQQQGPAHIPPSTESLTPSCSAWERPHARQSMLKNSARSARLMGPRNISVLEQ